MAFFTVRVELIDGAWPADYEELHEVMKKKGFLRTITIKRKKGDEITYKLPPAEYSKKSDDSTKTILKLTENIISKVWNEFRILVTKSEENRGYHNLEKDEV